ncbi:hypothetical protein SLEP1_g57760 [Rubroshorea leprosula]|uniref:Uncharacterized protein n=1 Tax=Rubroshorea leprosula TaxID=152421 RepID=A0AAV5MR72_9ROSI|nr:hypothetical protein SLEP1_g57760 [Rubroshorea leprosula]
MMMLDHGDGKEVNLEDCPRTKLQQECVKYLGPKEREAYEVVINERKLFYKISKKPVTSTEGSKLIFVLSTSRKLYVGEKKKGLFHHSSFLAGAATIASGVLTARNGILEGIWPNSGHYRPTDESLKEFCRFLEEREADLTNVKKGQWMKIFPLFQYSLQIRGPHSIQALSAVDLRKREHGTSK